MKRIFLLTLVCLLGDCIQGCKDDKSCSLNGLCDKKKKTCVCDAAWTGDDCSTLNLVPGRVQSGLRAINVGSPPTNTSSWGGAALYDSESDKYYMWASAMEGHCGMHTWTTNSQIVRASSTDPLGLYDIEGVEFPVWSHEVDVVRAPTGEYVAFFSYENPCTRPLCTSCSDGSTNPSCLKALSPSIEDTDPTYMSWSMSPTSGWSKPVLVMMKNPEMDSNFAPVILSNGTLVGMWRDHHPYGYSTPHIVVASNWTDPSTYAWNEDPLFDQKYGLEDMFLWIDARDKFHVLFHQLGECPSSQLNPAHKGLDNCVAHGFSEDGVVWYFSGVAATADTFYDDGTNYSFPYLERPHLVFDKTGKVPIGLTNGVKPQYPGLMNDDQSFTLLRPLATPSPSPSSAAPFLPTWTATTPNASLPQGGLPSVPGAVHTPIFMPSPATGTYNHAVMLDHVGGRFVAAWKNGADSEDKSGQRILFSTSVDGSAWTPGSVLFPNMTTSQRAAAVFVGPLITINGRVYAGASPGEPTGAAQGAQFCLWPDPVNPRNCGPPGHPQANGTLLMRRLETDSSTDTGFRLGPVFWASGFVPGEWAAASKALGFMTVEMMDATTRGDVATLSATEAPMPCPTSETRTSTKCEACVGGCPLFDAIPASVAGYIGNERAHYSLNASQSAGSGAGVRDVVLYRSGKTPFLWASTRGPSSSQADWSAPVLTNIPNDESNLNAGSLPDGRVYLFNNAVFRPKDADTLRLRTPLTLALSSDGREFDTAMSVVSCHDLPVGCAPHFPGSGKNPGGGQYPQAFAMTATGGRVAGVDPALFVAYSVNKEAIYITRVPYDALS